jgi:MarR family transcriptional regulator, 2-MHQ and catechol-resistance regulon repressor
LKRSIIESKTDRTELWRGVSDSWKKLTRQVENNLAKIDLGIAEFRILKILDDEGATPMALLSHKTLVTQAAVTVIIDNLERRELVQRSRSVEDRRVINVEITSKGRSLLKEALRIHKRFLDEMLEVLTDSELENLRVLMTRLASNTQVS